MENKVFYIKFEDNQAVKVSTHIDAQRVRREFPLEDVADLIGAVKQALPSKLGGIDPDELTLHEVVDGDALRPGRALSDVTGGKTDDDPLIIKSKNHVDTAVDILERENKRYRFDLENFRPMTIDKIEDYENMLGQSLFVCDSERIWSDNRKYLNQKDEVIITDEVIRFIDLLKHNFIDQNPEWDGLLMRGISGSGKSVEFALGAAYLASFQQYDVYWFRTGEMYPPSIADVLQLPIIKNTEKRRIIFVDQADKLENRLDTFIGSGSEINGVFTIGCASGNARVTPSSSRATRIQEYLISPSLTYRMFMKFFSQEETGDLPLTEFHSFREMLAFEVQDFPTLYIGTCGHFLTMAKFRNELEASHGLDFSSIWNTLLKNFSKEMTAIVSEKNAQERCLYYSRLHKLTFLNSDLPPYFEQTCNPDHRYIHNGKLFSPLFAQAYRIMLLSQPPSKSLYASLRNMPDFGNPSIFGFCIERYVIDNICKLEQYLIHILPFKEPKVSAAKSGTYCFSEKAIIPQDILARNGNLRWFLFIPLKWNERNVDIVVVFTRGSRAAVVGIQITLQSASQHSASLSYFRSNDFEKQLQASGYDVYSALLFVCNRDTSEITTFIEDARDKEVFDFPLYGIVEEVFDHRIIKGHGAEPICRKITVTINATRMFSLCKEIKTAQYTELRKFCKDIGGIKYKKTPSADVLRREAYSVHCSFTPCSECSSDVKANGSQRLIRLG